MDASRFKWEAGKELSGVNGKITVFPLKDNNQYSDEVMEDSYVQRMKEAQNRIYQIRWIMTSKGKLGKRTVTTKEQMSKEMDEYNILKLLAGGDPVVRELTQRIYRILEESRIPTEYYEDNSKKIKRQMLGKYLKTIGYKKVTIDFVLERVISDPAPLIYDEENDLLVHNRYVIK